MKTQDFSAGTIGADVGAPSGANFSCDKSSRLKALLQTSGGFTLWELMIVVALVVTLFVAAIENLLPLRGEAERATHLIVVGNLRSAIGMESMRRVLASADANLAALVGENPMNWLTVQSNSYAGVLEGDDYYAVARGGWSFDADNGLLFYRVRYPEYFEGTFTQPPGIRYRVDVVHSQDGGIAQIELAQLDAGQWTTSGSEIGRWIQQLQ